LLVWDKDSYTERFLALLQCTCILQSTLVHFYQTSSLLPCPLPIVASANLRLLYSLLNMKHINHIQILGFLLFPYSSRTHSPLSRETLYYWFNFITCKGLFKCLVYSWFNFGRFYVSWSLFISSRFSSLLEYKFLKYSRIIL
jgi:hypothetical protein